MTDTAILWEITHAHEYCLVDVDGAQDRMVKLEEPIVKRVLKTFTKRDGTVAVRRFDKKGTAFRIYDDDGNLYYRGRYYRDPNYAAAFNPLKWATWNAGATRIDYRQPDGTWETL